MGLFRKGSSDGESSWEQAARDIPAGSSAWSCMGCGSQFASKRDAKQHINCCPAARGH